MVFIETGNDKGAEHCQNRSAPPQGPVFISHPVKGLSPAIKKRETDQSVTDKVAGLADDMMYLFPSCRVWSTKMPHPQWIKPSAGVRRRHRGGGFKSDHENAQHGRDPIQYPVQDRVQPKWSMWSHYEEAAPGQMKRRQPRKLLEYRLYRMRHGEPQIFHYAAIREESLTNF